MNPVKDRAVYEASSPLKYIRNEKAPLLVLQGENDIRVPKEEAQQVVDILKGEGRMVEAVFFPEERPSRLMNRCSALKPTKLI